MGSFERSNSATVRSTMLWSIQPKRRDKCAAMTVPAATASPCSHVPVTNTCLSRKTLRISKRTAQTAHHSVENVASS